MIVNTIRARLRAAAGRCGAIDAMLGNLPEGELRDLPDELVLEAARLLVRVEKLGTLLDRVNADADGLHGRLSSPLFDGQGRGRKRGKGGG